MDILATASGTLILKNFFLLIMNIIGGIFAAFALTAFFSFLMESLSNAVYELRRILKIKREE